MSAPFDRICELLTTLPGLPSFWRESCLAMASQLPVEIQTRYLEENLEPLDKYFRPAADTEGPLQDFCRGFERHKRFTDQMLALAGAEAPETVYEAVGWFLDLAMLKNSDPIYSVVMPVCCIAFPLTWDDYPAEYRGVEHEILGRGLFLNDFDANSVAILEKFIGLEKEDYLDPEMETFLNASPITDKLPNIVNRTRFFITLSESLRFDAKREPSDAAMLLESYLGIKQVNYHSHKSVASFLRRKSVKEKLYDATMSERYLMGLSKAILKTERGKQVDAVMLLETCLGIDAKDYNNRDGLIVIHDNNSSTSKFTELKVLQDYVLALSKSLYESRERDNLQAEILLETFVGIEDYHYINNIVLSNYICTEKMREKLGGFNGWLYYFELLIFVTGRSSSAGGDRKTVALQQAYLGIKDEDLENRQNLLRVMNSKGFTYALSKQGDPCFFVNFVNSIVRVKMQGDIKGVLLFECFLGIEKNDYLDRRILHKKITAKKIGRSSSSNDLAYCLHSLAEVIVMANGRNNLDAVVLLETYLDLSSSDYVNHQSLIGKLESKKTERLIPDLNIKCLCLKSLAKALRLTDGRGSEEATMLLEAYLGISSCDYVDHETMGLIIRSKSIFASLPDSNSRSIYLHALAETLRTTRRDGHDAVVLLEAYLGITPKDYVDKRVLVNKINSNDVNFRFKYSDNKANYFAVLSNALTVTDGREGHASILLEAYLGLEQSDYYNYKILREKICSECIESKITSMINRANFLEALANALLVTDERPGSREAALLLEAYLDLNLNDYNNCFINNKISPKKIFGKIPSLHNQVNYFIRLGTAIRLAAERENQEVLILLRAHLGVPFARLTDSPALAESPAVNRIAYAITLSCCMTGSDPETLDLCRSVVSYVASVRDEQLPTYRHRLEFLTEAHKIWPELQRLATERIAHELSEGNEAEADRLERELMLWAEQFKNRLLIERLFTEGTFLGTDGASALEGWSPWRPIPESGTDSGGEQPRSDTLSSELSLLTLRSDLQSEPIVSDSQQPQEDMSRRSRDEMLQSDKTLEELIPLGALYIRVLFDNETPESGLRWWAWRNEVSGVQKIASGISDEGARNILEQAVEEFDQAVKDYEEQAKNECVQTEQKKLELEGQARRERWDNDQREGALKELDEELRLRTEALHVTLQTAFECYTDAMNSQFDLSELVMQGEDVVLHVEGPLLAMPLAWLRGSEGSLWETAESTSVSVSLTLQHVSQQFTESLNKKALFAYPEKPLKKTCVDTALQLGETWERWRLGEDQPEATVSNLRAALNAEHRFGLVFIHAHGDRNAGAILQGNQAWDGRGADLRHTDVLFFACCSTGRLSDKGASEVEGQYARIAEHRGRTVVAARWPVGLEPTEQLSIRFAQAYDRATESGSSTPFAKARAFALARREALRDSSLPSDEAFIAAFEIYGNA